jgi:hypothetical protein
MPLKTPFRLVIGFITILTARNYNHLSHSYTFTQFTITTLQSFQSICSSLHVFSLLESHTLNKSFNSNNKSSHDELPVAVT